MSSNVYVNRKLWLAIHLWLGLIAGAVLSLSGVTGSILVFRHELEALIDKPSWQVTPNLFECSPTELANTAEMHLPIGAKINWVEFPLNSTEVVQLSYSIVSNVIGGENDSYSLFLNPYTAELTGSRLSESLDNLSSMPLIPLIFNLHYSLLMGESGSVFLGITGIFLIVSVLTGLILWWPLSGNWRRAFLIKLNASFERYTYDIHKSIGLYHSMILLVLLISGISMNLPVYFNKTVELFTPLHLPDNVYSKPITGIVAINWGAAAKIANNHYPEGKLGWLIAPKNEIGIFQVCKTGIKFLNKFVGYRCIWIDQYSQEILRVVDAKTGSLGDVLLQWQWPLHSGRAFGSIGRLLIFISGLACPVLYVTGILRWRQKRKAANYKTSKQPLN